MEIRNVLVPVDFSPASRLAVDFAVQFAKTFQARLTILHVVESSAGLKHASPIESETARKHEAEAIINGLSKMRPLDGDDLDVQDRIRSGNIEEEIFTAIDDEFAGMVVVGTHHHGPFRRLLIGSMTEDILRSMSVPLLTVTSDAYPRSLRRILFATDLTESSREGFRFALELARTHGATLIVHHSIEPMSASPERKLAMEHALHKLSELELEGARRQVVVITEVTEGAASEKILEASEESDSELIVLTIHHKGLLERAILGSTAERIVRDAHVPVLSFPVNDESSYPSPREHLRTR